MKKTLVLIFGILFLISFISAASVGTSSMTEGRVVYTPPLFINYSLIPTVNDSEYWDGHSWSDVRWLEIDGGNANVNIDIGIYNFTTTGTGTFGSGTGDDAIVITEGSHLRIGEDSIGATTSEIRFGDGDFATISEVEDDILLIMSSEIRIGSGSGAGSYASFTNDDIIAGNITADYFLGDGSQLTGIEAGVGIPLWLNTSNNLYINSSYPQSINISGNATFGGGAIFKGATLGDLSLGYDNIRFGVYAGTPRIMFDNGTYIGQIDYISNSLRFIINDSISGRTRARLRINSTTVKVGENLDHVDLKVWGDLTVTGIINNPAIYCESSELVDQIFLVAGIRYRLNISNVDEGNGISMITGNNGTNITIDTSGVYHMVAQPQVKAGAMGGGNGDFHLWLEKNTGSGFVDIPDSNIELALATNDEDVIVLATTLKLNQGDVLRLVASVSDVDILLHAQSPAGEPVIPSIIFTMYRVGS